MKYVSDCLFPENKVLHFMQIVPEATICMKCQILLFLEK